MTLEEAVKLYYEAELFLTGDYRPPADSKLRAVSKKLAGGSTDKLLTMTCLGVMRVIANHHMHIHRRVAD